MTRHQATTREGSERATVRARERLPSGRRSPAELLGDSRILRLAAEHRPMLSVVVDTEEEFDWFEPFDCASTSVSAIAELPRAQSVFDDFGIRPTYAVDYAIVSQPKSVRALREIYDSGRAEIAAHQHPWVCPPKDEEPSELCSYPGNLPAHLEREKLLRLTDAIEAAFRTRPSVYKAGRHGIGPNTREILEEAGFEVDMSARPAYDFGDQCGPDFSAFPSEPYYWGAARRIVGIPETGAFVGFAGETARPLYRLATRGVLHWARLPGILSRVGAVERMLLSPEGFESADLRRLTRCLLDRGVRAFVFCFHSPSLKPGCTPYVNSEAEREELLGRCRDYFEFFLGELGGMALTPMEVKRHLVERAEVLSP